MPIRPVMEVFRPIPVDVLLVGEPCVVDLFMKLDDTLVPFLSKGGVLTGDHLRDLERLRVRRMFIKGSQAEAFEEYVQRNADKILTDPTVPSRVKAATFYISSMGALKKAFVKPDAPSLNRIKKEIVPLLKGIMKNEIVLGDLLAITQHDFNTYTHSVNVGIYATAIAVRFYRHDPSYGMNELERLSYGFFLHDIGKSRVPLSILRKRGPLSDEERSIMKKHPEWGYAILMETGNLTDEAAYIAMQHHERPDGTGYPLGTKDIHPCARICALADIFDALTSKRPYKDPMSPFAALKLLKAETFTVFDHELLTTFIQILGPDKDVTH
ncbi:MAG TPA: HD domain-containing phosphohydrolase [Deltaproteobacteria bacterium]|nr:HD domain-containing phosphohydrolase [Deltaproteobacteria bacterium]